MAITTFIPELWDARILANLNNTLVYANLVNRNYENEIKQRGDTVHIASLTDVTVKSYTNGTDLADPDSLTMTDQTLIINQADYFSFKVNDVDKVQANASYVDQATQSASYKFSDKVDSYIAGLLSAGTIVTDLGSSTTPLAITTADLAYSLLVKMKTAMDKANVPKSGRWVVMPPDYEGFMLLDSRFAAAYGTTAETNLKEGSIARACGFDIYISNNVPNTSSAKYKIIASTNDSCTYADQIIETEAMRMESDFADNVRGLHVYGAKVTRPAAIAVATVNFTSAS